MCRKIQSITVIVCLLALSSVALGGQMRWTGGGTANDWCDPTNWEDGTATAPPGELDRACIEGKAPMPWITDVLTCQPIRVTSLEINPWMWEYGPEDINFIIDSGTFDTNCTSLGGTSLQYNLPGWTDSPGVLIVNGGLLRMNDDMPLATDESAPPAPGYGGRGLWVGGGSTTWWINWGNVIVNGGEIRTPKIAIYNGDMTINTGGLVYDTNDLASQFIIRDNWDRNKIYISGGTLKLKGNRTTELTNFYINSRRIVAVHGALVGPTYNAGTDDTTLTSDRNDANAWEPSPEHLAVNVRFHTAHPATGGVTLSWKAGEWIGTGQASAHYVYLGAGLADVTNAPVGTAGTASAVYMGVVNQSEDDTNDPNIFITEAMAGLIPNKAYYWRVDEVNDACAASPWKGVVWKFTTINDKAKVLSPASGAANLTMPLELTWTAGDWSPSVSRVYFGTNLSGVSTATTDGRYRGTVSGTTYPLANLLLSNGTMAAFPQLLPNTTYTWRVDCDNYTGGNAIGIAGTFDTGSFVSIENFQKYEWTADLNQAWIEGPLTCSTGTRGGSAKVQLIREGQSGRYMQFTYDKSGGTGLGNRFFSETGLLYNDADWTPGVLASPVKLLEIAYRGAATNANDPDYDMMYAAIEDTSGNVNIVLNPDPDAQLVGPWTTWAIAYNQLDGSTATTRVMDLNHVDALYLGMGQRCLAEFSGGGEGNVMFDNLRVLSSTCVPAEGPVADFDGNCTVDWYDLDVLANDWLAQDINEDVPTTPPGTPALWYKFDETFGDVVTDYGTHVAGDINAAYNGTVNAPTTLNWDTDGGRIVAGSPTACIYLPNGQQSYVEATTNGNPIWWIENSSTQSISVSVWSNADITAYNLNWPGLWGAWDYGVTVETIEVHCPSPFSIGGGNPSCNFTKRAPGDGANAGTGPRPLGDFGGRWNNWIFVHDRTSPPAGATAEMRTYLNGTQVAEVNNLDDADVAGPLTNANIGSFRVGTRGGNWGMWAGRQADFKVFDYTLSQNEINHIATDGTGHVYAPISSPANIKTTSGGIEIVNFGDLALMVDEWMTEKLWP